MAEDREFFEEIMRKSPTVKEDRAFFEEVEKKYQNKTLEEDKSFHKENIDFLGKFEKQQNEEESQKANLEYLMRFSDNYVEDTSKKSDSNKDFGCMEMEIERSCGKIDKIVTALQEIGIIITPETVEQIMKDCQGLENANKEIAKRIKKVCDKQQEMNNKIKVDNGISR